MPYPVFSWNPERWMSKFVRQIPHEQVMAIPCTLIYSGILLGISVLRPFRTPWKNFHLHKWCSKKGPLTWKIYLKCNYNNQLKLTPADHWPPAFKNLQCLQSLSFNTLAVNATLDLGHGGVSKDSSLLTDKNIKKMLPWWTLHKKKNNKPNKKENK